MSMRFGQFCYNSAKSAASTSRKCWRLSNALKGDLGLGSLNKNLKPIRQAFQYELMLLPLVCMNRS